MKQFKKIVGWIGTIIGAPFYFLDIALDYYSKKRFLEISLILVYIVVIWSFFYTLEPGSSKMDIVLGIAFYILGGTVLAAIVGLAQGIIAAIIAFVCIPGSLLYEICAPLRMEPLKYAEWLKKKEARENKTDYDTYVKNLQKMVDEKRKEEEEASRQQAQYQREQTIYNEAYKRAYTEGFYRAKSESTNNNAQNTTSNAQNLSNYQQALALFMLDEGFTLSDLKKQYHRLLKTYHPDNGGVEDDKYSKKITLAFETLKPYAK